MTTVKLSRKNQLVMPREAREHLGVKPGDELLVIPRGKGVLFLVKPRDFVEALAGTAKGVYGDSDSYLRRERASWRKRPF